MNPFKRLTDAEMAEKCSKGICFRCDKKFAPGYTCMSKTLQVLLVGDEEEDEDSDAEHVHLDSVEVLLVVPKNKIYYLIKSSAIFTAVASFFFWQWQLSLLAVETSSGSGNSITGSGNALCILFPIILP
nr:putative mitochondrial protein [Tanacetum cinerariifolium]